MSFNQIEYEKYERERTIGILSDMLENETGKALLDAGCGNGRLMCVWQNHADKVYGVDIDTENLEKAKWCGMETTKADMRSLPFGNSAFDIVVSVSCFMCFKELKSVLIELRRVCGRIAIISFPTSDYCKLWGKPTSNGSYTHDFAETMKQIKTAGFVVNQIRAYQYVPPRYATILGYLDEIGKTLPSFGRVVFVKCTPQKW